MTFFELQLEPQEEIEELNRQYALRLQEFQDARKDMAKIAAKKNVPWHPWYTHDIPMIYP